jgi:hypothetical protein
MIRLARCLVPCVLAVALAGPAVAQVPQLLSYQGTMLDQAGQPYSDGVYTLTFRLYAAATGGTELWAEPQSVTLAKGSFGVQLGAVTALTLPFDQQYWLGVQLGSGSEMTPRVMLASSPYSLSLRLPFSGTASTDGPAFAVGNTLSGAAMVADGRLEIGSTARPGSLSL